MLAAHISALLTALEVDLTNAPASPTEERRLLRAAYLKLALLHHPDKGGDEAKFEAIQSAYESLAVATRDFSISVHDATLAPGPRTAPRARTTAAAYEAAAAAGIPGLRVEVAKSSRSICKVTGKAIPKGALRVGKLEAVSGTYGQWCCLEAWRVPAVVYDGFGGEVDPAALLPLLLALEGILFSGLRALSSDDVEALAVHCVDTSHWAKQTAKTIKAAGAAPSAVVVTDGVNAPTDAAAPTLTLPPTTTLAAPAATPRPPLPDHANPQALAGCVFVLSGTFVGGGTGLTAGKDDVKAEIGRFGGRVVGSISGKTTHLLVGSEPGASKLQKARIKNLTVIDEAGLKALLCGEDVIPDAVIDGLSGGFRGGGMALAMSADEVADLVGGQKRLAGPAGELEVKRVCVEASV